MEGVFIAIVECLSELIVMLKPQLLFDKSHSQSCSCLFAF